MKKLIIACAAVLVLGLGLTTVGHVLGGQFYSVYYDGALHPFSDVAQNFSDKFVNISDHIVTADEDDDSDFDTSWVQDYLETRRNAIEHGDMPIQSVDQIDYIDLALNGGEFTIENGSDFAVSASVNFADTQINGTHWTASLWANDEPATITLPRDGNYLQIRSSCGRQANVTIYPRRISSCLPEMVRSPPMNCMDTESRWMQPTAAYPPPCQSRQTSIMYGPLPTGVQS